MAAYPSRHQWMARGDAPLQLPVQPGVGAPALEPAQDAAADEDAQGHAQVRYTLPQLPLNKGRYRVGVYLLCAQGRYVYEWMDPIAHIELEHSGQHQGPWLLAGDWTQVPHG